MFNIWERRNNTLKRINRNLKRENDALKQELALYDIDKLNEQFELAKSAYDEYMRLIDELTEVKGEYRKLIGEMKAGKRE